MKKYRRTASSAPLSPTVSNALSARNRSLTNPA
jgi:hypothetical protein